MGQAPEDYRFRCSQNESLKGHGAPNRVGRFTDNPKTHDCNRIAAGGMTQRDFSFSERGEVRRTDPETSHIAAMNVKAGRLERLVLEYLIKYGSQTIKELAAKGNFDLWSIGPRFAPLRKKGAIRDSGETRLNPGSTRKGIVWAITDVGRAAYAIGESDV